MATGEAELRDGDYFGTVLNRAARVMAAGHGGQILVADSTAGLLSGVDLLDLGPRRLRDVSTPVGVFQVRAPGLRTEFPPLRTLDADAGESAACRPRSFIGRESEVDEVQAAVDAHRLGDPDRRGRGGQDPPGVWKSRRGWPMSSPTGSGFSNWPRSPIRRRCPTRWRRCWASRNNQARPSASRWPPRWRAGSGLLVFDNCEHVLDAAADLVEAILAHSATVRGLGHQPRGVGGRPTSSCGRCPRWTSAGESTLPQSICSSNAPRVWRRASRWPQLMRRARWWRSAGASTGSRWRSSWRRRGWCR